VTTCDSSGHSPRPGCCAIVAADSASALAHFQTSLRFETDCSDVYAACAGGAPVSCCIRVAQLGRPVKLMIGGLTGWLDEGFEWPTAGSKKPL
jgi:hypothetical protein